ncbi:DUF3488 and transglutaminase-like domain-containing protein [Shewanella abyssi]|uniref:transglutaminase TgpA family protein n=1 Tax=Shewanella abyssi TaxID=311789 RepID=UPI00200D51CF|nr:DUF3488 and transglutaminase-like domain-containing protein [Shewanella abyssi]MCL1048132.1 DUF3488 and transglutaminase-like domain-containing protein [Shewanella abyssi]
MSKHKLKKNHSTSEFSLSRHTLMWLLITNVAIITPLYQQITLWSLAICIICIIWRLGIYVGKVARPPRWLVTSLGIASAITLTMVVNQIGALIALINLLILGYALKYIEMRNRRDVHIVVLVGYFLIALTFIQQQALWSTLHLMLVTLINTCVLVSLYNDEDRFQFTAKLASKIILQSFPLAILLFLVIPRLPPLWMVPTQGGAKTGLSNTVSFANITELTRSAELAFRATFTDGHLPENRDLYWRAIVMEDYDGQQWSQSRSILASERSASLSQSSAQNLRLVDFKAGLASIKQPSLSYSIIAEPSSQQWLFGLDVATSVDRGIVMLADHRLYARQAIEQQKMYKLVSYPAQKMEPVLPAAIHAINLVLPKDSNPKTIALADQFKQKYPQDQERLDAMMRYFTEQPYYYTLRPPAVGREQIDDFLLNNKAGFCVHYASAFAFMARATGIPARIVSGYQGGEYNAAAGYYSIYQYMAHAWVEVWLPNKGWTRYDPTTMIAPDRIEQGFDAFFDPSESYLLDSPFGYLGHRTGELFNQLRLKFAGIDYLWSVWVLGFDSDKQQDVLQDMLGEVTQTRLALLILISLTVIGLAIAYSAGLFKLSRAKDKHVHAYLSVCHLLAKRALPRLPHEGPEHYNQRVALSFPTIALSFDKLTRYYVAIQYQPLSKAALKRISRLLINQSRWLRINIIKQRLALNKTNT